MMSDVKNDELISGVNPLGVNSKKTKENFPTNDPTAHHDSQKKISNYQNVITEQIPPEQVHQWQRKHIKKAQGKEGYPLNVIIDPAMRQMYQVVHDQKLTNVFDRYIEQQPQCRFCIEGLSCQLCANGPCRISKKSPRGVCGVDAHVMVARNFTYRHVTIGTSADCYHAHQAARVLLAAGQSPESGLKIRDEHKLRKYAEMLDLDVNLPTDQLAVSFANAIIKDICRPQYEPSSLVEAFAPDRRKTLWRKLEIFPGGANAEVAFAQSMCMTNLAADPVKFLLQCLRLGIANEFQGLFALDILQEILMGTQKITQRKQNMGLLRSDLVNIVTNGHMPLVAHQVIQLASQDNWQERAKEVGANGIQVLGHTCEGQQLMNYSMTQDLAGYGGQEGEWLSQEYLLATGVVDLFMFDYNCTEATLPLYAKRFGTKLVSVDPVIPFPDIEAVEFLPEKMSEQAEKILEMAIHSFIKRQEEDREVYIPPYTSECVVGFSTESLKEALGGSWQSLIDHIVEGNIRGIATIIGCTTAQYGQGGSNIFKITSELIKNDILVLSGGCTSAVMEYTGLTQPVAANEAGTGLKAVCKALKIPPVLNYGACVDIGKMSQTAIEIADTLDVDTNLLPIVIGAPEYLEQKAVADACSALAMGWLVHIAPVPSVTGSDVVIQTLTETTEELGLGKVMLELDATKAVNIYRRHIEEKRRDLGLSFNEQIL